MKNNNRNKGINMDNASPASSERRQITSDRRTNGLRTILGCIVDCRRDHPQRFLERQQPYYSDFYESWLFVLIVGIVLLCVADAAFTLKILASGGRELNPVMDAILASGPVVFFLVKYGLTTVGLLICLVHIRYQLFRIPMRTILLTIFGGYQVLVAYEISILMRL